MKHRSPPVRKKRSVSYEKREVIEKKKWKHKKRSKKKIAEQENEKKKGEDKARERAGQSKRPPGKTP